MTGTPQVVDFQPFPGFQKGALFAGRFRLERGLGSGKLGATWAAQDQLEKRVVALKFLPFLLATDREIIRRELAFWIGWNHRCFAETYGLFEDGNVFAISGELIGGLNLQLACSRKRGHVFDLLQIEGWLTELSDGLTAAYQRFGFAHGEIKPTNLLLDATGHLKVVHFGLTTLLRLSATDTDRTVFQDPSAYASHQVRNGALSEFTDDVFSIGVVLFELLTGELPPGDSTLQTSHELSSVRTRLKTLGIKEPINDAWDSAIINCLQADSGRRPRDVAALAATMKTAPNLGPSKSAVAPPEPRTPIRTPPPVSTPPPPKVSGPMRPPLTAAVPTPKKNYGPFVVLLASGAIAAYLFWPKPQPVPLPPSVSATPSPAPSASLATPWPSPSAPLPTPSESSTPWAYHYPPPSTPWPSPTTPFATPWPEGERYPQTRSRLLTEEEVANLGYAELRYAINEMYARYGASFPNHPEIQNQFRRFEWYHPNSAIGYDQIDDSMSEIEKENVKLLARRRDQKTTIWDTPVPEQRPLPSFQGDRYPQTRQRLLTEDEVRNLSYGQLRYAINEMYARYGATFPNHPEIENQFRRFSWYQPNPSRSFDDIDSAMSDLEKENVKLLARYRAQKGPN